MDGLNTVAVFWLCTTYCMDYDLFVNRQMTMNYISHNDNEFYDLPPRVLGFNKCSFLVGLWHRLFYILAPWVNKCDATVTDSEFPAVSYLWSWMFSFKFCQLLVQRPKPPLTPITNKVITYKPLMSFSPVSPYYMDDSDNNKYYISGTTATKPVMQYLLIRYI